MTDTPNPIALSGDPSLPSDANPRPRGLRRLLASFLLLASASWAAADELHWIRQLPGCMPPSPSPVEGFYDSFACGSLGVFTFSESESVLVGPLSPSCQPIVSGSETPKGYPSLTSLPQAGTASPCADGSCLDSAIPVTGKWVAVVDWGNWHGRSVSWMIGALSGVQTTFFDLQRPDGGATSDVDVLRQLCAVAEHVAARPDRAPAVINLSFGRPAGGDELGPCSTSNPRLSCEIRGVLDELSEAGSFVVGAAGNHDTLLFPAAAESVIAAGGLDVPWFRHAGESHEAWQTPDFTKDLMPASGLCLDDEWGNAWTPPPGTSFSAALLSAWVAGAELDGKLAPYRGWHPVPLFAGGVLLGHEGGVVPGSSVTAIDRVFDRLRSGDDAPRCFGGEEIPGLSLRVELTPAGGLAAQPLCFLERTTSRPTPDPDPCLPCSGGWVPDPGGGGLELKASAPSPDVLSISLAASPGVPEDLRLVGLRLLISRGEQFFDLEPVGMSVQQMLRHVELASFASLEVAGLEGLVFEGDELSLVYLFEATEGFGARPYPGFEHLAEGVDGRYWSATPIHEVAY